MIKTLKNILVITIPTLIFIFIMLELFFRFIIPANEFPMHYYDTIDNVYKFDTNYRRDGVWTVGKFAQVRGKWHINDEGWNDNVEYPRDRDTTKKLIAMFGDSQLEAFMAGIDGNLAHYLRQEIGNEYDIFRFGKSDAPYSQYLQMNRYCNKYWDPDILIFLIMHNDFLHSIRELSYKPHFLQLQDDNGIKELTPTPISQSVSYKLIVKANYHSAFLRYLFYNLRITKSLVQTSFFRRIQAGKTEEKKYSGNIDVSVAERNKKLYPKYFEYFVRKIKQENKAKRIIFVMDGLRKEIMDGNNPNNSDLKWMHEMVSNISKENQIEFIDLNPVFYKDFITNQQDFNPPWDGHWNSYSHKLVANELLDYLTSFD